MASSLEVVLDAKQLIDPEVPGLRSRLSSLARLCPRLTLPTLVRVGVDGLLINLALFAAVLVCYLLLSQEVSPAAGEYPWAWGSSWLGYLGNAGLLTGSCLIALSLGGLYSYGRAYRGRYKLLIIAQSVTLGFLLFGLLQCLLQFLAGATPAVPWSALVLAWLLTMTLLVAARLRRYLWQLAARLDRRLALTYPEQQVRTVLVIGGAGYIGSALLPKLLNQGYHVRVLDRLLYGAEPILGLLNHPRLELHRADFRQVDKVVMAMRDVDAVIHLGAIVGDPACALDEDLTIEINLTATRRIAEIAKGCGVSRFIFASTCSVYGASDELLDEGSALNPVSLYARSKIACEQILEQMAGQGFAPVIFRFGTIYGLSGRTRFDLVVNLLAAKAKMDGIITVCGGDQWRPFVHVDDAAEAVFAALMAPASVVGNQVFNVGSDEQNYTIGQMAEIIHGLVPSARLVNLDSDGDRRNYRVRFHKIHHTLGFRPRWTIDQGVRQVLQAIADGDVEDYRDPKFNNAQFLKKEGPTRLVRREDRWARDLILKISATLEDPSGGQEVVPLTAARFDTPSAPPALHHRGRDKAVANSRVDSNGNGHG
jgi:nucleoside-diphosphate-sugar epimerase